MSDKKEDLKDYEYDFDEDYEDDFEEELSFEDRFYNPETKDIDCIVSMWRKIKHEPSLEVQNDQTQDFSFDPDIAVFGACSIVANHLFEKIFKALSSSQLSKIELSKLEALSLAYKKASVLVEKVDEDDDGFEEYLASLDAPSPFNIEEKRLAALGELLQTHKDLSPNEQELLILYAEVVWTMSSL